MNKIYKRLLCVITLCLFFIGTSVKADVTCNYRYDLSGFGCSAKGTFYLKFDSNNKITVDPSLKTNQNIMDNCGGRYSLYNYASNGEKYMKNNHACPPVYIADPGNGTVEFQIGDDSFAASESALQATNTGSEGLDSGSNNDSSGGGSTSSGVNRDVCKVTGIPMRNQSWTIDIDFKIVNSKNKFAVSRSGYASSEAFVDGIASVSGYTFSLDQDLWVPIFARNECPDTLNLALSESSNTTVTITDKTPDPSLNGSYDVNTATEMQKQREEEKVNNDWFNDSGNVGDNFCSEPAVKNVLRLLGYFLLLLRLAVPLIIIAKGTFLFYNAVTKDSSNELSKSAKEFGIKIAIGIAIFFIPTLISAALGLYYDFAKVEKEYTMCSTCLLKPTDCE